MRLILRHLPLLRFPGHFRTMLYSDVLTHLIFWRKRRFGLKHFLIVNPNCHTSGFKKFLYLRCYQSGSLMSSKRSLCFYRQNLSCSQRPVQSSTLKADAITFKAYSLDNSGCQVSPVSDCYTFLRSLLLESPCISSTLDYTVDVLAHGLTLYFIRPLGF